MENNDYKPKEPYYWRKSLSGGRVEAWWSNGGFHAHLYGTAAQVSRTVMCLVNDHGGPKETTGEPPEKVTQTRVIPGQMDIISALAGGDGDDD